jgi:preprotein translocase subunit SecA
LLKNGKTLEDIKFEAYAVAREAAKRVIGEFPYYVQLLGGISIHYGNISLDPSALSGPIIAFDATVHTV